MMKPYVYLFSLLLIFLVFYQVQSQETDVANAKIDEKGTKKTPPSSPSALLQKTDENTTAKPETVDNTVKPSTNTPNKEEPGNTANGLTNSPNSGTATPNKEEPKPNTETNVPTNNVPTTPTKPTEETPPGTNTNPPSTSSEKKETTGSGSTVDTSPDKNTKKKVPAEGLSQGDKEKATPEKSASSSATIVIVCSTLAGAFVLILGFIWGVRKYKLAPSSEFQARLETYPNLFLPPSHGFQGVRSPGLPPPTTHPFYPHQVKSLPRHPQPYGAASYNAISPPPVLPKI